MSALPIIGRHAAKVKSNCVRLGKEQPRPLTLVEGLIVCGLGGSFVRPGLGPSCSRIARAMRPRVATRRLKPPTGGMGGAAREGESLASRLPESDIRSYVVVVTGCRTVTRNTRNIRRGLSDSGKAMLRPPPRDLPAPSAGHPYPRRGTDPATLMGGCQTVSSSVRCGKRDRSGESQLRVVGAGPAARGGRVSEANYARRGCPGPGAGGRCRRLDVQRDARETEADQP